jgi:large subunit ribosomal protein L41
MSLSTFFRTPSILNNTINDAMRRRHGIHFRKGLGVYNYKVGKEQYYKNPHAIPLDLKERLKAEGSEHSLRRINTLKRLSITPFGRSTNTGNFKFDAFRVPNYNIPDLTEFPVKIY